MKADYKAWECPATEGTPLEQTGKALYYTGLSKQSESTLFAENYHRELSMSYIDAANVWYVATTRASQTMILVAPVPAKSHKEGSVSKISDALFDYVNGHFVEMLPSEGDFDDDTTEDNDRSRHETPEIKHVVIEDSRIFTAAACHQDITCYHNQKSAKEQFEPLRRNRHLILFHINCKVHL